MKHFKKPRTQCAACGRTVSVTARLPPCSNNALAAHKCKHGLPCIEANSGNQVNNCRRCIGPTPEGA